MKYHKSSKNKGFTLVELVVSMAIFATIVTLAMAAFMNIAQTKSSTSRLKNTQYKARITTEIVNRLARDADRVTTDPSNKTFVEFYYRSLDSSFYAYRVESIEQRLEISSCVNVTKLGVCDSGDWSDSVILIGEEYLAENVSFGKKGGLDSTLEFGFSIASKAGGVLPDVFSDEITIKTSSVLENIK